MQKQHSAAQEHTLQSRHGGVDFTQQSSLETVEKKTGQNILRSYYG